MDSEALSFIPPSPDGRVTRAKETEPSYPFDAVVLLCGGTRRLNPRVRRYKEANMTPHLGLNFESVLKVAAAAQAYDEKLAPVIISSGGTMWGDVPLGHLMAESLSSPRYKVPKEAIIEENEATDTGIQMKNILDVIKKRGFQKVAVIADSVHLKVAVPLLLNWASFEGVAVNIEGKAMEDLIVQRNPRYQQVVDRLHTSRYWERWTSKYERLAKILEKDPRLTSFPVKVGAAFFKLMRTKPLVSRLRLPGTTK